MLEALESTQDPGWVLSYDGYNVLNESAVESRFAFGNGFLGMRAARSVSRGPTWVAWLVIVDGHLGRATYVAGLFDVPNTKPPVPALWCPSRASAGGIHHMGDTFWYRPEAPIALAMSVGRSLLISITGKTVHVTLTEGEAMEMRIAAARRKLTPGTMVEVSV